MDDIKNKYDKDGYCILKKFLNEKEKNYLSECILNFANLKSSNVSIST